MVFFWNRWQCWNSVLWNRLCTAGSLSSVNTIRPADAKHCLGFWDCKEEARHELLHSYFLFSNNCLSHATEKHLQACVCVCLGGGMGNAESFLFFVFFLFPLPWESSVGEKKKKTWIQTSQPLNRLLIQWSHIQIKFSFSQHMNQSRSLSWLQDLAEEKKTKNPLRQTRRG